jgi:hypothetical protein
MQSAAMRRNGAETAPVTMQSAAMRRNGAETAPVTMHWGYLPAAQRRGDQVTRRNGADDRAGDDAERSDEEERRR